MSAPEGGNPVTAGTESAEAVLGAHTKLAHACVAAPKAQQLASYALLQSFQLLLPPGQPVTSCMTWQLTAAELQSWGVPAIPGCKVECQSLKPIPNIPRRDAHERGSSRLPYRTLRRPSMALTMPGRAPEQSASSCRA